MDRLLGQCQAEYLLTRCWWDVIRPIAPWGGRPKSTPNWRERNAIIFAAKWPFPISNIKIWSDGRESEIGGNFIDFYNDIMCRTINQIAFSILRENTAYLNRSLWTTLFQH